VEPHKVLSSVLGISRENAILYALANDCQAEEVWKFVKEQHIEI